MPADFTEVLANPRQLTSAIKITDRVKLSRASGCVTWVCAVRSVVIDVRRLRPQHADGAAAA